MLGPEHPHLLDLEARDARCACRACAVLFDRKAAGAGQLRRIPDRRWRFGPVDGDDLAWAAFGIPVELAFFVVESSHGGVVAYYPSPLGVTRADVDDGVWAELVAANPALGRLDTDVEALLVRQHGGARQHFLVPIDDCFRLVATMRRWWQGFSGGPAVWAELEAFFEALARKAKAAPVNDQRPRT